MINDGLEFIELLPSTKDFRQIFRDNIRTSDVKIIESKTRDFNGSFWNLMSALDLQGYNYRYSGIRYLRNVSYICEAERQQVEQVWNYAQVLMTLQGKKLVGNISEIKYHSENTWKINAVCVIAR